MRKAEAKCKTCKKKLERVYWEIMKEIGLYERYCNKCIESVYKTEESDNKHTTTGGEIKTKVLSR